ncbi:MAG TPA: hypothetical protein VJB06_02720 [archaeon]|nr:hypothetical protein [archaeon]
MTLVDELLKNKEEILIKVLQFLEGKEATTKLNLDGMQFSLGGTLVKLNGEVEVTVVKQVASKKKK